jgi:hypothetical protein
MQKKSIIHIFGALSVALLLWSCGRQEQRAYDAFCGDLEGTWNITKIILPNNEEVVDSNYTLSIVDCNPDKDDPSCTGDFFFKIGQPTPIVYTPFVGNVRAITLQFVTVPMANMNPDTFRLVGKTYIVTELTDSKMLWENSTPNNRFPAIEFER